MTAQVGEGLRFRGVDSEMAANPLERLFATGHPRPPFVSPHTACWRGYVGSWEVRDDRLYLAHLRGHVADGRPFGLTELFPDAPPDGVFADWCADWLRVPRGGLKQYVHMGYASEYERDLFLAVHGGRLVAVHEVTNAVRPSVTRELTPRLDEVFPDDAAFIRALHVNWADRLPRLVYADWLDERSDARGELLRVDVALADAPDDADLNARRAAVLESVKDWFWMKLVGCDPPRDQYGWERRVW